MQFLLTVVSDRIRSFIVVLVLQHSADPVPKQSPGSECLQGPGDGSAVFTFPGKATPVPGPLYPVPTGASHVSERLHQVQMCKMFPLSWSSSKSHLYLVC